MGFLQPWTRRGCEWWSITTVVFVIFGHVAAPYQRAEWPITHHWRSARERVCMQGMYMCSYRDGEIKKKDKASMSTFLRFLCVGRTHHSYSDCYYSFSTIIWRERQVAEEEGDRRQTSSWISELKKEWDWWNCRQICSFFLTFRLSLLLSFSLQPSRFKVIISNYVEGTIWHSCGVKEPLWSKCPWKWQLTP